MQPANFFLYFDVVTFELQKLIKGYGARIKVSRKKVEKLLSRVGRKETLI